MPTRGQGADHPARTPEASGLDTSVELRDEPEGGCGVPLQPAIEERAYDRSLRRTRGALRTDHCENAPRQSWGAVLEVDDGRGHAVRVEAYRIPSVDRPEAEAEAVPEVDDRSDTGVVERESVEGEPSGESRVGDSRRLASERGIAPAVRDHALRSDRGEEHARTPLDASGQKLREGLLDVPPVGGTRVRDGTAPRRERLAEVVRVADRPHLRSDTDGHRSVTRVEGEHELTQEERTVPPVVETVRDDPIGRVAEMSSVDELERARRRHLEARLAVPLLRHEHRERENEKEETQAGGLALTWTYHDSLRGLAHCP